MILSPNKIRLFLLFLSFLNITKSIIFVGMNQNGGFNFDVYPEILVDPYTKLIFAGAASYPPATNDQKMSYSVCAYDSKNFKQTKIFLPIVTKNALVNDILEANPLWNAQLNSFSLLQGITLEPKFYPMASIIGDSRIFIFNNLNIYENKKNNLITTDPLLDINGNEGQISQVAVGSNEFIAAVLPDGSQFDNLTPIFLYDFIVKEKIIPIPGTSHYFTLLKLTSSSTEVISNETPYFLMESDFNCNIIPNTLSLGSIPANNAFYVGFSGSGPTGIKIVSMIHNSIISQNIAKTITTNKIIATNEPNTFLYLNQIAGITLSTGLSYLIILGGTTNINISKSILYGLPIINFINPVDQETENLEEINSDEAVQIGQLANINSIPTNLFNSASPHIFINTVFTNPPLNANDLYSANDPRAVIGAIPLTFYNKKNSFQDVLDKTITSNFIINNVNTFKDSVFSNVSYIGNDNEAIGGIFYSQALLNEYGSVNRWTLWMRKNINGNITNSTYIPFLGSHFAIYQESKNTIVTNEIARSGPFPFTTIIEKTAAAKTGIQKIIDIPYTHPAIGFDNNNLSPSYAIYLGNNTVIMQQTANNSGMKPIIINDIIYGVNGRMPQMTAKNNTVVFQGGVLEESGVLWTSDLAFTNNDAWLVAGGSNGVFILSDEDGNGTGVSLLQANFTGLGENQSWRQLGSFGVVRKIVPSLGVLFVIEEQTIWRIEMTKENISKGRNCTVKKILSVLDLPNANIYSSFIDGLVSLNNILIASSCGLFAYSNINLSQGGEISPTQIILPECFQAQPISLYPVTYNGCHLDWAHGASQEVCGNIYVLATSLSNHYSMIYRLVSYGNEDSNEIKIKLLPNFFINNIPTYYYNPELEILSIASDGASLFSHGVTGNSILFHSYVGLINPFIKHGIIPLKFEYNFIDLMSQSNTFLGYPTYISGLGVWLFVGQNGIQGLV